MSNFVLMTDSCCDLSAAMADELNLSVLPLSVIQDGKEYRNEQHDSRNGECENHIEGLHNRLTDEKWAIVRRVK